MSHQNNIASDFQEPPFWTACSIPMKLMAAAILFATSSGCMNPQFTRFPTWNSSFPSAENAAFERQDPFPDPNFGPSTDSTPRGYDRPRALPRQAAEQRLLQGVPVGPENVPAGVPQGGFNTSKVVR